MSRVSLPKKAATRLLQAIEDGDVLDKSPSLDEAIEALRVAVRAALAPKKYVRAARKVKASKKRTKAVDTKTVRAAVMARAEGRCEYCKLQSDLWSPMELDHAFGRVRAKQSERNCWALCGLCHREKTRNEPSAAAWLNAFAEHCDRHDFQAEGNEARKRLSFVTTRSNFGKAASK